MYIYFIQQYKATEIGKINYSWFIVSVTGLNESNFQYNGTTNNESWIFHLKGGKGRKRRWLPRKPSTFFYYFNGYPSDA